MPEKTLIARLDPDGVYLGTEEIDVADLTDAHVHLPDGCDLSAGKYRWLPDMHAFWPIEEIVRK